MKDEKKVDPLLGGEQGDKPEKVAEKPKAMAKPAEKPVKPAEVPSKPSSTETVDKDIIAETKAILEKQPKASFIIPMAEGEKPGAYDTVQINGYKLTIQKGVWVELPKAVVDLLAQKYKVNMTAGMEKRIDREAKVSEALS